VSSGCLVEWDGVNCWPAVSVGEIVSVSCPPPLLNSHGKVLSPKKNFNTLIVLFL